MQLCFDKVTKGEHNHSIFEDFAKMLNDCFIRNCKNLEGSLKYDATHGTLFE